MILDLREISREAGTVERGPLESGRNVGLVVAFRDAVVDQRFDVPDSPGPPFPGYQSFVSPGLRSIKGRGRSPSSPK